jgi:hypothetical protein
MAELNEGKRNGLDDDDEVFPSEKTIKDDDLHERVRRRDEAQREQAEEPTKPGHQ